MVIRSIASRLARGRNWITCARRRCTWLESARSRRFPYAKRSCTIERRRKSNPIYTLPSRCTDQNILNKTKRLQGNIRQKLKNKEKN